MFTQQDVEVYLTSQQNAWALSTQVSERARLTKNLSLICQGPEALAKLVTEDNKYSMKTLFIRASQLQAFCNKGTSYRDYMRKNANLFKNAYTRKAVEMTFEQAVEAVKKIPSDSVRAVAASILGSGLRATEALGYEGNGVVIGKGGRPRYVFINENLAARKVSYQALYKALRKVNLSPHDLRKLAATKLVEAGLKEADLLAVMGWTNMQTASLYLQPKNNKELSAKVNEALKVNVG